MFKFFKVGGCVRDELMGLKSKDIDYTVVADDPFFQNFPTDGVFIMLEAWLETSGYKIWLSTPDCFTIRAKFPDNHKMAGITADFVLARKEKGYIPGTRQPIVEVGTLYDDLLRRDFTVNAIAQDEQGNYIDLFNGKRDILKKILRTPLPIEQTFNEDPLRILRAIRFQITKGFIPTDELFNAILEYDYSKMKVVSEERIREELTKCFKFDTKETLTILYNISKLKDYIFNETKLWLKPTTEQ